MKATNLNNALSSYEFNNTNNLKNIELRKLLKKEQNSKEVEKLKKVSRDFEAIFTGIMLKSMRGSISKSKLLDGGNAEDIFRTMLDAEYAKIMSAEGSPGLAKVIEKSVVELMKSKAYVNNSHTQYKKE